MEQKGCFICCKKSFRKASHIKQLNTVNRSGTPDENFVDDQLEVIFLLRKLLEIPEDICCKLLKHFGNPSLWIEYCDSCSVLVEKCQEILNEIAALEKNYEKLRMDIKSRLIKSQKHFDYEYQCETIVRSQIILKDIDYFIETNSLENLKDTTENINTENEDVNFGYVYMDEDNYSQTGCDVISNDADPLENVAESIFIPENQGTGEIKIGYHTTEEDLGNNTEAFQTVITEEECDHQEMGDKMDIKPLDLLSEEETVPTDLLIPPGETIKKHYNFLSRKKAIAPKKFQRRITMKSFGNSRKRQASKMSHLKMKIVKCDICGKCFGSNSTFRRHLIVHSNVKQHQCDMCGQRFGQKASLTRHKEKIHTTDMEYPFTCVMCGKEFTEQQSLKVHYRLHTEEKDKFFKCLLCKLTCSTITSLKSHIATHSRKKLEKEEMHSLFSQ